MPPWFNVLTLIVCCCIIIQTLITIHWIYNAYCITFINKHKSNELAPLSTESSTLTSTKLNKQSTKGYSLETEERQQNNYKPSTIVYNGYIKDRNVPYPWDDNAITKLYTLMSLFFACIWCWIFGMYSYILVSFKSPLVKDDVQYRAGYLFICIIISRGFKHLYYLDRLHHIFDKSAWKVNHVKYTILKILIIISLLVVILYFVIITALYREFNIISDKLSLTKWFIGFIYHFTWEIMLLFMLIRRLILIKNEITCKAKIMLHKFRSPFVRFILIATTSMISSLITLTVFILYYDVGVLLAFIDTLINSLGLMFTYGIYLDSYKFFCYPLRLCCE